MPGGRPTKYKPEYAEQAGKLCKLGATLSDLAEFFGVAISTVCLWKVEHEQFSEALKKYKAAADANVERSLYERAMGYSCTETKAFVIEGEVVTQEVIKHYPPDTTAMIYWLKNRQPEKWRQNPEGGDSGVTINNIMPVPVADSVDSWESAAQANQDQLLKRDDK